MLRSVVTGVRTLVDQGVTPDLDDAVKKRIRLTNGVSLFGVVVMLVSIPFDRAQAPRWMLAEDLLGAVAFLGFLLLNRAGLLFGSRLLCLTVSNLIVLGNAVLLGRGSGAHMVFFALAALPFALFDLRERGALAFGVVLSIACFALVQSGRLTGLESISDNYSPATYYLYSATVTFAVLLFSLVQTSLANARAEDALRRDIQERLRAEKALAETRQSAAYSAKMAALGEMSSNVAHEVNNPLSAILLRAQRLRMLGDRERLDVDVVARTAQEIETTVQRIRRIVDALRSFARDAENDPVRAESVRQIVTDTIELCAERFQQHAIALHVDLIPGDLHAQCRGVQISQVLLNLLGNAHDAVEALPTRWTRLSVDADDAHIRIAVADSGPGVAPELVGRIMEPFFTTKDVGKGTGLGLSVSKGIAEAHGGHLVYDRDAAESRFVLTLRRAYPDRV